MPPSQLTARPRNGWFAHRGQAALLLCSLLLASLAGCRPAGSGPASQAPPAGQSAATLTPVRLMLNWYPEAEHGGYYAALVHGYFREAGLDVTIEPGGPNAPVIQQVARGGVDFGIVNADQIVTARAQDARLKALFAPLHNSPRCLLVHKAAGIERLDQLRDVTIMMSQEQAWAQYLIKNLPLDGVTIVPNTASLAPFLSNSRAAKQGYIISEPFVAQREGGEVRSLLVADLGFNPYTSVLVARDQLVAENSPLIASMAAACRRGWETYLQSPEQTNQHIHQLNPEMSREVLAFGVQALREHCLEDAAGATIGAMTAERWRSLVQQLEQLQMIEPGQIDPASLFLNP